MDNNVYDFVINLNKLIGRSSEPSSPSVNFLGGCSVNVLLEGKKPIYIFCPKEDLQNKIKKELQKYVKRANLHFIVTTHEYCENNHECHGHYVDPYEAKPGYKCVFIDALPKYLSGAYLHFFNQKNYMIFELMRKPEHELEKLLKASQKPA